MRFLLIDRITEWNPGESAVAVKSVSMSEDFFEDHFPLSPIMPGVLILEGMAQLSGFLISEGVRQKEGRMVSALMSIVDKVKFRKPVFPGDSLTYRAKVLSLNEVGSRAEVRAFCEEKLMAECIITFALFVADNPVLERRRGEVLALWLKGISEDG